MGWGERSVHFITLTKNKSPLWLDQVNTRESDMRWSWIGRESPIQLVDHNKQTGFYSRWNEKQLKDFKQEGREDILWF